MKTFLKASWKANNKRKKNENENRITYDTLCISTPVGARTFQSKNWMWVKNKQKKEGIVSYELDKTHTQQV